jgi:starch phosphorylase
MSIIEEWPERQVRMAHLAAVGAFSINGVAELQTSLLQARTLGDFGDMWPEKFNNKTNGVTPRRWLKLANPRLSELIASKIGDGWLRDLDQLCSLEPYVQDADFCRAWREIKHQNKVDLASLIETRTGTVVDPNSLFDIMVKRLHEYKRQLLKALHIITLYQRLKDDPAGDMVPRTFIFGAKAAPGYHVAKLIIKLINAVAETIHADPVVQGRLKVVFLPNFNVSLGERIYPAADVSEQISMAGKEASGTGNMKFALNGALTVGTLDGANIEIRERVGAENFFLFGLTADEVLALKAEGYDPMTYYQREPELKQAIDSIAAGDYSGGDRGLFEPLVASLLAHDEYLLLADYASYVACQDRVAQAYRDPETWTRMSILNAARCGFFSSDRTILEYDEQIWQVPPLPVKVPQR